MDYLRESYESTAILVILRFLSQYHQRLILLNLVHRNHTLRTVFSRALLDHTNNKGEDNHQLSMQYFE